ncbi:TPA: discoidin domain-containing protein, partial [Streptococcus suis]
MNRQDKNYQKLYHYSIRKRNWGVGSVVVGIFLAGMLQAPTVLANTGATASEPTIENQADTGGGATGGSEVAQPTATTPAPGADTTTPAPTPAPAENAETRTAEEPAVTNTNNIAEAVQTTRVLVPVDLQNIDVTSNDPEGNKLNTVDNQSLTHWASSPNTPNTEQNRQTLTVRLMEEATVSKVLYTPRQQGDRAVGNIKVGRVLYSTDGVQWHPTVPTAVKQFKDSSNQGRVGENNTFILNENRYPKFIEFEPVVASHFRLEGIETHHYDNTKLNTVVAAAEFRPIGYKEISDSSIVKIDPQLTEAVSWDSTDNRRVEYATDGRADTFWQSDAGQNNRTTKQYLKVGLSEKARVGFMEITPRQDGNNHREHATGDLKRGFIEYQSDDGSWVRVTLIGGNNNNEFVFGGTKEAKVVQFQPVEAQFFRIGSEDAHHWENGSNNKIVAIAEVSMYGNKIIPPVVEEPEVNNETNDENATPGDGADSGVGTNTGEGSTSGEGATPGAGTNTDESSTPGEGSTPGAVSNEGDGVTPVAGAHTGEGTSNQVKAGNYALVPVSAEKFTVIGDRHHYQTADGYQRGLDNILNADLGEPNGHNGDYLTELKWTGGPTLPVTVGFQLNTPQELNSVIIHKRVGDNGTLTHYKVKVYRDSQEVFETEELSTPQTENDATFDLSSFGVINKVELVFTKTVSRNDQVNLTHLTVKGVTFLEKSRIDGEKLPQSNFTATVEDPSKYHNGRDISKLLDDNNSSFAEYRWSDPLRLPERIIIQPRDNSPKKLAGFTLHKRAGQGGSVVKYNVETYRNNQLVEELRDLEVPFLATYDHRSLNGELVDRIVLTVTEAKNRNEQPTQTELTLRGLTFYEKVETPLPDIQPEDEGGSQTSPTEGEGGSQTSPTEGEGSSQTSPTEG